ncbi:allantoicase [Planctomyces bekefii]|uniref:Allantoicase n=1 Tax=Planctomyces bekefii TaxID=1653850 RepID=A0A5C6MCM9_9PLAN|nr:allantoicase [Planctomyces bekefii]
MPKSPLNRGSQNFYGIQSEKVCTYIRFNIYPDGGVARLRVYGEVRPDFSRLRPGDVIDLAAVENGGTVLSCNDMFFGPKDNLIMPGRGVNMGDGWETKRKRQLPGSDWVIVALGAKGVIARLVIDTCHFKGNYPDRAMVEGICAPGATAAALEARSDWQVVLAETPLEAHKIHEYMDAITARGPFTHVRLRIFPDGGVSRLRVFGSLA